MRMWRSFLDRIDPDTLLSRFQRSRILVIGDVMLDEFIWGKVSRISPEAPVPVVAVTKETRLLGGAANVVHNLSSLGAKVALCGIIGRDRAGEEVKRMLDALGVETDSLLVDGSRPTTVKTRVIAHHQQVVRFDKEDVRPLRGPLLRELLRFIEGYWGGADGVIISDYGKGVIGRELMDLILKRRREDGKLVVVDPKMNNFHLYQGVSALTPNTAEAEGASQRQIEDERSLEGVGKLLLRRFRSDALLITRGEEGMALFERGKGMILIPTVAQEVYDVTGAGDTVVATFTLCVASGMGYPQAAAVANCAAGVVVGKVGTAVVTPSELKGALLQYQGGGGHRGDNPAPGTPRGEQR